MIINAANFSEVKSFKTDICIIGAGVAGITLATELLKSNNNIIILESGEEAYKENVQKLYESQSQPKIFPDTLKSRLRMLGGSSNHWENSTERFDPIDFQKRSWVSESGWPFSYSTLEPYYNQAEDYCGVGYLNDKYKLDYWMKNIPFNDYFSDSVVIQTAIIKSALIPTRFFSKYGAQLTQSNKIQLITGANIVDVDYNSEGQEIKGISFKTIEKMQHKVTAKIFIMCLGGIENARMLLTFNEKNGNNIGNQYDNVGRYFMEHPTIRGAHFYPLKEKLPPIYEGFFRGEMHLKARIKLTEKAQYQHQTNNLRMMLVPQTEETLSHGISSAHILSKSIKEDEDLDEFGAHLMNVISDIDIIANLVSRKSFDFSITDSATTFGGYQLVSMIEQTPDKLNRVNLSNQEDILGIKKVNIEWRVTESDKQLAWRSLDLVANDSSLSSKGRFRVLEERESRIWNSQLGFGQHHIGTTRMSTTYKKGVVNKECKVYGCNNLYIGGSSVFPTGGHVPPTLTIIAMSIKLADDILKSKLL